MMEHAKLVGGPADGRKLVVKDSPPFITVAARERNEHDRPHRRRRHEGKRDCRYRRTDRGTGSGLIPKCYEYAGAP
jgi:hypothetical protein